MEDNFMVKCSKCNADNVITRDICRNCGAILDKSSRKKQENTNSNVKKQQINVYTNLIAKSFKDWSNRVLIIGIIVLIIMIISSIAFENIVLLVSAFGIYAVFIANSLLLSAVAEIIQKLQNIEDNTKK